MILSVASIILVIIRIGIGLGLEFVEKKEIREMRKKIDDALKKEWIDELQDFLKSNPMRSEKFVEVVVVKQIAELGEATRYTQTASTLLKVLQKMIFDLIKYVIAMIVFGILVAIGVWFAISIPPLQDGTVNNVWAFVFIMAFIVIGLGFVTRNKIRVYVSLRSHFYELSENPSLSEAKKITEELEKEELIYA